MNCPRCGLNVSAQQNSCSACGFSASLLHHYLGSQWVRLERITDPTHCIRLEDVRKIEIVLDDFERSFPQSFFAAYLGVLPNGLNVAELGFWLLNQGAFNTHSVSRRNDFGIMLVADPSAQTVAITLGYAVEGCFGAGVVARILQTCGSHLAKAAFGTAIEAACRSCGKVLSKHARSIKWKPEAADEAGVTPNMGLQPLRSGHKQPSRPLAGFSQGSP